MLAAFVGHGTHPILTIGYFDKQLGNIISAGTSHFKPRDNDTLYQFNSLGYRSAEFDPHAQTKIFVCGCSYTFGMGVPYEETWPIHLARLIAAERHLSERDIAVQNFSQIGASNDYIARTIVQQCARVRPDFAVVAFTHLNRAEYLTGARIANLGHWNLVAPDTADTKPGKDYFRHYNDQYGLLTTLKNMHWVQSAMQARGIPFVFAWIDVEIFREASMWTTSEISQARNLIDMSRFCQYSIKEAEILVDVVDGHPGPHSHRNFASKLFETMQGSETNSSARREAPDKRKRFSAVGNFATRLTTRFTVLKQRSGQSRDLVVVQKFSDGGKYLRDIADKFGNNTRIIRCVSDDMISRRLIAACEVERPNFACAWFSGAAVYEHVAEPGIVELQHVPTAMNWDFPRHAGGASSRH